MRALRRRSAGQVPPARRLLDLRGAGPPRAAVLDALSADRRARQLRLEGRGRPGRLPVHRGQAVGIRRADACRDRGGHRRFRQELRRKIRRAVAAPRPSAIRLAERIVRHSGRLLHPHPLAQPEGSRRRRGARHPASAREAGGRARAHARARFPGRRPDHLAAGGDPAGLRDGPGFPGLEMQVGTRAARARAMADRDFRAAARRLREAGVRGDRSACEPEAWARKEGSQPGAKEDEAVHPRSDRPGRRARRKRSQVQIAPGDRAPFFASESGGADGGAARPHRARDALRGQPHLARPGRPARDQGHRRSAARMGRVPRRHRAPPHAVPPRQVRGAPAHRRRQAEGLREDRRDHQADPLERGPGGGKTKIKRAL